ncbi:MAG TPA: hypothetical protein VFV33_24650, partial [Gemmatimonadaceae bacterium]|nr:hypothetical protein [Gemmatimonadaceae bacterium]
MSRDPITGVFNDAYIAEVFESYRRDPASVEAAWRQYFGFAESLAGTPAVAPVARLVGAEDAAPIDPAYLRKVAAASSLAEAIRQYGHLQVPVDPLGSPPPGASELTPEFHGITEEDLRAVPAEALGIPGATA